MARPSSLTLRRHERARWVRHGTRKALGLFGKEAKVYAKEVEAYSLVVLWPDSDREAPAQLSDDAQVSSCT